MSKTLTKIAMVSMVFLMILSFTATVFAQTTTTNNAAAEAYQKAKTQWQQRREELQTKKQQITEEAKKQDLEKAKTMVLKAIDRTISKLQKIIQIIQKMKVITEERKTKIVSDLNAQITTLQELKSQVSAATTKEELKSVVGDVKNRFVNIREIVKKIVSEILASHIDKTIEKLNSIVTKLETEIANLKTQGQNVTDFEKTLTDAKTLLSQATDKNKAGDWKGARNLAEQARDKLSKLAGEIKAAKAKLQGGTSE